MVSSLNLILAIVTRLGLFMCEELQISFNYKMIYDNLRP
jgi:hypothetical protein